MRNVWPATGSLPPIAPAEVSVLLSEGLDARTATLEVRDADAVRVDRQDVRLTDDGRRLSVSLPPLTPGIFTVWWKVSTLRAHRTERSARFTITG